MPSRFHGKKQRQAKPKALLLGPGIERKMPQKRLQGRLAAGRKPTTGQTALARLAGELSQREIEILRKAIPDVETLDSARDIVQGIARKFCVSSGDLEQALALALQPMQKNKPKK